MKISNPIENVFCLYNKDTFLKVKPDGFKINKFLLSFGKFNSEKKLISNVDFWLDVTDALTLCNDILNGKLSKDAAASLKKASSEGKNFANYIRQYQGGIGAAKCKEKNLRSDGAAMAKVMKITPGNKMPIIFQIEQGKGEEDSRGLIVPRYGYTPDVKFNVAFTRTDLIALAKLMELYYNSFISSQFTIKGLVDDEIIINEIKKIKKNK